MKLKDVPMALLCPIGTRVTIKKISNEARNVYNAAEFINEL